MSDFKLRSVIHREKLNFIVSTVKLKSWLSPDRTTYETMVFAAQTAEPGSEDSVGGFEVSSYLDLYCQQYDSEEDAVQGHAVACREFQPQFDSE